jgi:hypothetical protein
MAFDGCNEKNRRCRDRHFIPDFRTPIRGRSTAMAASNLDVRSIIDVSRRIDVWRSVAACGRIDVRRRMDVWGSIDAVEADRKAALRVTKLFLPLGLGLLVVSPAAFPAQFPAMMLAAPERAVQILTDRVARMREEPNLAVLAMHRATGQFGTSLQNGVERDLILTNKRTSTLLLVPILGKRENLLDADDEKARLSAMLRILSFMPSSYLLDAKAPRGGRGFSSRFHLKADQPRRPNTPRPKAHPAAIPCPAPTSSLHTPT